MTMSKHARKLGFCIVLLITGILVLSGCGESAAGAQKAVDRPAYLDELRGAVFDPPRALSDFSFASTTGEPFILSEHRGEVILIYFGYRACPDFCPTTFAELKRVYAALGEPADRLKIAFVTVDPERDTLEYLAAYTAVFHRDFMALREEGEKLQVLMDQFGVVAEKVQLGESAMSYLMDHTASLFLIGPDGRLQVQYLYGTDHRDIIHDLELILGAI